MMKTITRLKKIEHSNQTMGKYKANIPHENLWQWLWIIRTDETKQNPYARGKQIEWLSIMKKYMTRSQRNKY